MPISTTDMYVYTVISIFSDTDPRLGLGDAGVEAYPA